MERSTCRGSREMPIWALCVTFWPKPTGTEDASRPLDLSRDMRNIAEGFSFEICPRLAQLMRNTGISENVPETALFEPNQIAPHDLQITGRTSAAHGHDSISHFTGTPQKQVRQTAKVEFVVAAETTELVRDRSDIFSAHEATRGSVSGRGMSRVLEDVSDSTGFH
ncbi:unnamed protein product [Notodromas monacha]|uniref:Uncharacterized protein n=1 Tax=Notodromas monacha TaxID=399045 RepID=A0A7R9BVI0_9CRUS|nr:unnamed protein product [Notodromas monacha]CAG0921545.1 unnamed protein product [Notodromas monacha]